MNDHRQSRPSALREHLLADAQTPQPDGLTREAAPLAQDEGLKTYVHIGPDDWPKE